VPVHRAPPQARHKSSSPLPSTLLGLMSIIYVGESTRPGRAPCILGKRSSPGLVALPLIFLSSPAAAAGTPIVATGSVTQISFTPVERTGCGAVFMFDFTEIDLISGDVTGTSVVDGSCVVRPIGTASCQALETFTGTIEGRSGTAEFSNVLEVDLATGSFSGRFTAIGGTGDLANLQGTGTFEGTGPTGTYALRITFAP
jgi:hypothetical protein